MKQKLTKNQQLWEKEQKRVERFIKRKTKEGFKFDNIELPTRPKRVTEQAIQRMKDIKPKKLYEQATISIDGQTRSAKDYISEKRSEIARKGWDTRRNKQKAKTQTKDKKLKAKPTKKWQSPEDKVMPTGQNAGMWLDLVHAIEDIPDERFNLKGGQYIYLADFKQQCLQMHRDAILKYSIDFLDNYIIDNWELVDKAINPIVYASDSTQVYIGMNALIKLLSIDGNVTIDLSVRATNINDYYGSDD